LNYLCSYCIDLAIGWQVFGNIVQHIVLNLIYDFFGELTVVCVVEIFYFFLGDEVQEGKGSFGIVSMHFFEF